MFMADGSDGKTYTVFVSTDYINAGTTVDPQAVVEGCKELRTSDGLAVNRERKGEYKVVQTGVTLRSDSPDAP
jgi:predicted transcriptional regulator